MCVAVNNKSIHARFTSNIPSARRPPCVYLPRRMPKITRDGRIVIERIAFVKEIFLLEQYVEGFLRFNTNRDRVACHTLKFLLWSSSSSSFGWGAVDHKFFLYRWRSWALSNSWLSFNRISGSPRRQSIYNWWTRFAVFRVSSSPELEPIHYKFSYGFIVR